MRKDQNILLWHASREYDEEFSQGLKNQDSVKCLSCNATLRWVLIPMSIFVYIEKRAYCFSGRIRSPLQYSFKSLVLLFSVIAEHSFRSYTLSKWLDLLKLLDTTRIASKTSLTTGISFLQSRRIAPMSDSTLGAAVSRCTCLC